MNISPINFNNINNINKTNNAQIKAAPSFGARKKDSFEKGIIVSGSETQAKIYTNNVDSQAIGQIKEFCNHPVFRDAPIRIMPDVHAGVNSVIGFSAPIVNGKVIPNIVGGDIGCGVLCVKFDTHGEDIDFEALDNVIKTCVSSKSDNPQAKSNVPAAFTKDVSFLCRHKYKASPEEVLTSLGTLGGGNHFIEIDTDGHGANYLVIHTGSRTFGKLTGKYHQEVAAEQNPYKQKSLSYLSDAEAKDYLTDMQLASKFSEYNRRIIADEILTKMGWSEVESFESIHNYISSDGIIRKGAICADDGKKVIIPLNMRDGSLLGVGKGNNDWNNTAPHGAGRQYRRSQASEFISFDDYQKAMKGIWSSCITPSHIDESPQAYKDSGEIIENVSDTVEIDDIISPVFNYKD